MVNIQLTIFPLQLNCSVSFEREERKACSKEIGRVKEIRARRKNAMEKKGNKISKTIEMLNNGSP